MDKKTSALWVAIAVLAIALAWVLFNLVGANNQIEKDGTEKTAIIKHDSDSIKAINNEIANLQSELENCQNQDAPGLRDSIKTLNANLDSLGKALSDCQESKVVKKATPRPVAKKPKTRVIIRKVYVTAPVTAKSQQPLHQVVIVHKGEPVTADLSSLKDGNEEILACFRTNGSKDQHFPHYAIDRGATVSNARGNNMKGYNYVLTPVESISGDVGVTKSGVFFISTNLLKKYLNMSGESLKYVDLLYKGNWGGVRMTLQGNYYVFDGK